MFFVTYMSKIQRLTMLSRVCACCMHSMEPVKNEALRLSVQTRKIGILEIAALLHTFPWPLPLHYLLLMLGYYQGTNGYYYCFSYFYCVYCSL